MEIRRRFPFALTIAAAVLLACCGGGGGGDAETSYGDDLNSGYEVAELSCTGTTFGGTWSSGAFAVTVPADSMSPCVNAANPTASADAALPAGFDVRTGEANVTAGGASYTLTVGERGFQNSADANQVTVVVPFDPTQPVADGKLDSLHVFVRFFNPEDGSLVDAIGDINPDNTVTVQIMGLPPSVTAAVIYDPNMAAIASAAASTSISAQTKATPYTWGAAHWCVLYSTTDQAVVDAFNTYKLSHPAATMQDMVDDEIAANAVIAQNTYVAVPFRQPAMILSSKATHPCGATLGTNARFYIHLEDSGTQFLPNAEQELFQTYVPVVNSDGNYYGRIYIQPIYINTPPTDFLYPILSTVAHEMFHAIQYGYDMVTWNRTVQGYVEGPATTYGRTIGVNNGTASTTPEVRSGTGEAFMMTNYLSQNSRNETTRVDVVAYSNQDFFAFVGRKYGSDNLTYLEKLYAQFKSTIFDLTGRYLQAYFQPPRKALFEQMDAAFQANLTGGPTLKQVYLDFVNQRAMGHDAASTLRSTDPTTPGVPNYSLFAYDAGNVAASGSAVVNIDPLSVGSRTAKFGKVAPFATRAIVIRPTQSVGAGGTGATIRVKLTPAAGSIGTEFDGFAYQNGTAAAFSSQMSFANFGMSTSDEIVILISNVQFSDARSDVTFTVDGENGVQGGGGGGANAFTLTDFSLPGEGSMTPAWAILAPDVGGLGWLDGAIASTTDIASMYRLKNLQVQMNTTLITGAGSYTILGDDVTSGPAAILYSPGTDAAAAGTGKVFTSTGGTITLSAWGTNIGDQITGSFAATMSDGETTPTTGTMGADFDFVVGAANPL